MAKSIDAFLKTKVAKRNSIFSRADFVTRVSAIWLAKYYKDYRIFTEKPEVDHMSLAEYKEFVERTQPNQRLMADD